MSQIKIKLGRLDLTFGALLVLYALLSLTIGPTTSVLVLKYVTIALGLVVLTRWSRVIVRNSLWRIRNRLMVAYFFIAVVPIVLVTSLIALGAYVLSGQLSIYIVTSEMDRRIMALKQSTDFLARSRDDERQPQLIMSFLRDRYPDIRVIATAIGTSNISTSTADTETPPADWPEASGLLIKDDRLHGWARSIHDKTAVTAYFPISSEFLGQMAPNLCRTMVLRSGMQAPSRRGILTFSTPGNEPTTNRVPPPANSFDVEVRAQRTLTAAVWGEAGKTEMVEIHALTRPSALLRVVFPEQVEVTREIVAFSFLVVGIIFLLAELAALHIGISITRTITGAVHDLYEGTRSVTAGDFSHRIPIQGGDQLAQLGSAFNEMTGNMHRLVQVEKDQQRLQGELEIAREVQNQLYPKSVPCLATLSIHANCEPARMVSGDFYDYLQLGPEKAAITIGDVAGKGISAALLMSTIQSSFRTQLRSCLEGAPAHTSKLVSQLNLHLHAFTSAEKFATFFCGVYDEKTSSLTYTNAGQLPPILVRNNESSRLDVNGLVVGAFSFAKYAESTVQLDRGDLLVFFTDGITEPENAYGEMFGEDRLSDLLVKNSHLGEAQLADTILHAVKQWTGNAGELQDDMTLLIVRRR